MKPRMQAVINAIDGGRVLDVGCVGHGHRVGDPNWLHGQLDRVAYDLVGIDIDASGIANLQAKGWDVYKDTAERLDAVEGPFDYIVASEVIEHLARPGAFLDNASGLLSPHGTVLLTTPNVWAAVYIRRLVVGETVCSGEGHTAWYDKERLRELCERCGYRANIHHLPPMSTGLSSLVYRYNKQLGGTRLFAELTYE